MTTLTHRRIVASMTDADLIKTGLRCSRELDLHLPSASILIEQLALRLAYEVAQREARQ